MHRKLFDGKVFARRVRVGMAEKGIDMKVLSDQIGVAHSSLSRICNEKNAPDVENYLRIEKWLARDKRK